jgi:hypothetical protein
MVCVPDTPQDECAELVEGDSAVEGGAKVVEGRMEVSWNTITLQFSYVSRRLLFSHQVWVSCIRARG